MRYIPLLLASVLLANPKNCVVEMGTASFLENVSALTIKTSNGAVLNWESFSISPGELTRFLQDSQNATVLNRVTGGQLSELMGSLQANGRVYLVNPSGIVVGKDAVINTAAFLATTLQIDFQGEKIHAMGESQASIENLGTISSATGPVVLLAQKVINKGNIHAPHVTLAAGSEFLVAQNGETQVLIRPKSDASVENAGKLQGIVVELQSDGAHALAINHTGVIQADSLVSREGRVFLSASEGTTAVKGKISGQNIEAVGERVYLYDTTRIDASSNGNAGTVLIGGKEKTKQIYTTKDVEITANSLGGGNGGRVIVWGDRVTSFAGKIQAAGGPTGGDGGFVEVSGGRLRFTGFVETPAPHGKHGTFLLDPTDITIGAVSTTGTWSGCGGGENEYEPATAADEIDASGVSPDTLESILAGACDVVVSTQSAEAGTGNITVSSPISWSSDNSLTLQADNNILVNADITCTGDGNLTLDADNDISITADLTVTGGEISAIAGGDITFETNTVTITGGASLVAVGDISIEDNLTIEDDVSLDGDNVTTTVPVTLTINNGSTLEVHADTNINFDDTVTFAGDGFFSGGADGDFLLDGELDAADIDVTIRVDGDITITDDITTNDGNVLLDADTDLSIEALCDITIGGDGDINLWASEDINIDAAVGCTGAVLTSVTFDADGDIYIDDDVDAGAVDLTFSTGGDIIIDNVDVTSDDGDLLFLAGEDLITYDFATIESTGIGDITLVVDDNNPDYPDVGDGVFLFSEETEIHTNDGDVALYAAFPGVNDWPGEINGDDDIPGDNFYIDYYYPEGGPDYPFVVYFKMTLYGALGGKILQFGGAVNETTTNPTSNPPSGGGADGISTTSNTGCG